MSSLSPSAVAGADPTGLRAVLGASPGIDHAAHGLRLVHAGAQRRLPAGVLDEELALLGLGVVGRQQVHLPLVHDVALGDRKSTRLNSSHVSISYAVFCLKKKKQHIYTTQVR